MQQEHGREGYGYISQESNARGEGYEHDNIRTMRKVLHHTVLTIRHKYYYVAIVVTTTTTTTIPFGILNTSVLLSLLSLNSIDCTALSVSVSRPVPVLFSAFFLLYYWYWSYYYWYYYPNHPCLLWLFSTTKQIIVITRRVCLTAAAAFRNTHDCSPDSDAMRRELVTEKNEERSLVV